MLRRFLLVLATLALIVPASAQDTAQKRWAEEFKRGYDLLVDKKYDEGMALMKHCLELQPKQPTCAYNLACAHALQGQPDPAIEWFGKSVDWGFAVQEIDDQLVVAEKDTDLDSLRGDPRFVALMEKMRAQRKVAEEYAATPAVYVPAKLAQATEVPLLVVLHAGGATKDSVLTSRWKQVADELGLALVAPSGRLCVGADPKNGALWYRNIDDFANPKRSFLYEKSVNDAIDGFKKQHKIDRTRVYLAGEGDGATVALHVAMSQPGLYKGVVALDGLVLAQQLAEKAANAVKAGLKVRLLIDRGILARKLEESAGQEKVDQQKLLDAWSDQLGKLGFQNALTAFAHDEKDPQQTDKLVLETLRGFQPQTVEAGASK